MTTPRMITVEWLKENTACADAIDLFCKEWPDGCEVTYDNLVRADAIGLNLEWFAGCVLSPRVYADYEEKCVPLYADYEAGRAPLFAHFLTKRAALYARRGALEVDYRAKCAPLYEDYLSKCCALLIPILLNHFAGCLIYASDKATTISVTCEEIADKGVWMEFCKLTGISEWAISEGQIPEGEEFLLTENQARELGFS